MKRVIFLVLSVLILVSCGTFPADDEESESTVGAAINSETEPATTESAYDNIGKSGLKRDSTVVFTGDSILDDWRSDRNDPASLGKADGPASLFNEYIQSNFPEDNITVYNTAYTGYTIQNLHKRYEQFITDLEPDYLIIYIGTNNAWHDDRSLDLVEADFNDLLDDIRKKIDAEIILFEPYLFESDLNFTVDVPLNTYVERMAEISDMVCRIGAERGFPVVYSRELFRISMEKYGYKYTRELTSDGIHPRKTGYRILFDALMTELKINGYQAKYKINIDSYKSKYVK
ncbi:MAG: hypothetical protein J5563_04865 [Clostridia bacterium]|nr:hypothetical protein [Clostridia bacterium]